MTDIYRTRYLRIGSVFVLIQHYSRLPETTRENVALKALAIPAYTATLFNEGGQVYGQGKTAREAVGEAVAALRLLNSQ